MKSLDPKPAAKKAEAEKAAAPIAEEKIDFSKVEIEPLFQEFVDFETFSKSDFRAVKVLACEAVKKSKTLLAITNLPPRPMMGIESCGMLISALHTEEGEEKLHLLMLDDHIPAGAKMY